MKLRTLALLLSTVLVPSQARAQYATNAPSLSTSTFQRVDENGVDLISGAFIFKGPRLRAGAAPREADIPLTWNGSMWTFPTPSIWWDEEFDMHVTVGESSNELEKGAGDSFYSLRDTSKMSCFMVINNFSPADMGSCSYSGHDGSSASYIGTFNPDDPDFLLPNGNIKAQRAWFTSPQGVGSSSILETPGKQTIDIDGWTIIFSNLYSTTASAILYSGDTQVDSLTFSTPSANKSDRYDDSVIRPEDTTQTITEADGSIWKFTYGSAQNLNRVRRPGSTADDLIIDYNSDHRVVELINALGTWGYAYSTVADDVKRTTVTKPDGTSYSVTYIRKKGNIRSHTDESGKTTTYTYSDYGNLLEIDYPEHNRVVYGYGTRGNVVSVKQYPKPTNPSDPVLETRAEYSVDCADVRNCNLPIAIIDPKGNRTDYAYNGGFLATETKPSPSGTDPRPQTRWTYGALSPRVTNASGALVNLAAKTVPLEKSECVTTANCVGTADEVRTLFDYGPASGPNPGWLRGVTVVHNGEVRRTCYDYDALGNKIAEHEPKANLDACYAGGASSLAISDASVTEGGALSFTVTRTGTATSNLSVDFATSNVSAIAGSDYNAASGTLTFTPTDTTKTIAVTTIDDTATEGAETLAMTLSNATGNAGIGDATGTGTINDNDGGGGTGCTGVSFRINDDADEEGNPLVFTVTKTGTTATSCSVSYATADGTAIAPTDFTAASGTLNFASNETTKTITITTTTSGGLNEPDETFSVNLSAPTGNATISDPQGVGTLYNYDAGGGGCPLC